MPLAILSQEDYTILDNIDTLQLADEYFSSQIETLQEEAKSMSAQDLKKEYLLSDINQLSLSNIILNLDEVKDKISSRVVMI